MNVVEPLVVALTQLRANKMRSFLTILGILIGVGSVMGVTSIGEGMRRQIVSEFEQVGGSKLIVVSPPRQWVRRDGRWVRRSWEEHLVVDDIQKISEECPLVETVIPMNASGAQLKYRKANTQGDFWGVNPESRILRGLGMAGGTGPLYQSERPQEVAQDRGHRL